MYVFCYKPINHIKYSISHNQHANIYYLVIRNIILKIIPIVKSCKQYYFNESWKKEEKNIVINPHTSEHVFCYYLLLLNNNH